MGWKKTKRTILEKERKDHLLFRKAKFGNRKKRLPSLLGKKKRNNRITGAEKKKKKGHVKAYAP